MIENIAIILLIFLSQLNIISDDQSDSDFLSEFVNEDVILSSVEFKNDEGWLYYEENIDIGEPLKVLPKRIAQDSYPEIEVKSGVVLDANTDTILFSQNSNEKLPIASLTKIMTALVILDEADLKDIVVISGKAFEVEGKKNGLAVGERISVEDLLKIMLVESNNIAATSLAEHTGGDVEKFVSMMNKKAQLLGMENTNFSNPSGLDIGENYSTAYEMAQLADYALEKSLIWDILKTQKATVMSVDNKLEHKLKNTNLLLGKVDNIVGGKTGFTEKAGGCLMLVTEEPKDNNRIISIVLDAEDRFLQTEKLVRWVFGNYEW